MQQRVYVDTSVFGGLFDIEFEKFTKPFFDRILNKDLKILYSSVIEKELENAPNVVKELIRSLPADCVEFVEVTEDAVKLAMMLLPENKYAAKSANTNVVISARRMHELGFSKLPQLGQF